jgi:hypothetical protein
MNRGHDESDPEEAPVATADIPPEPAATDDETPAPVPALEALRERVTDLAFILSSARSIDSTSALGAIGALGQRADSVVRGFLKGLATQGESTSTTETERAAPSATELVGLVLSRAGQAVSQGFHSYLAAHAEKGESGEVVVDGRFVWRHGAPLISSVVDALGRQMSRALSPEEEGEARAAKVDYRLDIPSILGSILQRPQEAEDRPEPPAQAEGEAAPEPPPSEIPGVLQ